MIVALDFDGTLCEHAYPAIGPDIGAFEHLIRIQKEFPAIRYILWTIRSGDLLKDAISWTEEQGIEFWGVNENPDQRSWSWSPKAHAHTYVDDACISAILIRPENSRPYLNWQIVGPLLYTRVEIFFETNPDLNAKGKW